MKELSRRDFLKGTAAAGLGLAASVTVGARAFADDAPAAAEGGFSGEDFFSMPMGQNTPEQLADKANIRELVEYERYCRDYHHYDAMKETYSEDSEVVVSWMQGTGAEFVEASKAREGDRIIAGGHKIFNTVVWLNGDKAIAEIIAVIALRTSLGGVDYDMPAYTRMLYRVQRENGVWKIKRFESVYEFDSIYTGFPVEHPDIFDSEELNTYRSSYKGISWSQTLTGRTPNPDLPGEDKPETIAAMYRAANEWLCS